MAELNRNCEQLTLRFDDRIGLQDEIRQRLFAHFVRLQGQMAVMGDLAPTLMQAVDDPLRLRLTACLQVAAGNFPPGLPPHFEEGFRESSSAGIHDIWETS